MRFRSSEKLKQPNGTFQPGHTGSWRGQPGFLAECSSPKGEKVPSNILDPTKKENFKFLAELFTELLEVFPEKFIHLGGDEV